MGRPKTEIDDVERYEKHKARMREYRKKRYAEDEEFRNKTKEYTKQYQKQMIENYKKAKEEEIKSI